MARRESDLPDRGRRRLLGTSAALTLLAVPAARAAASSPVVRTRAGRVRGILDGDLQLFRGIRYGADTAPRRASNHRSRPVRGVAWSMPRVRRRESAAGRGAGQSEDCLFLNVTAPVAAAGRARPVIVYIHGGAYSSGSGSSPLYDGAHSAGAVTSSSSRSITG